MLYEERWTSMLRYLAVWNYVLALGSPLPFSAITGTGTGDHLGLVFSELRKFEV
jgi:hypothetical protein